MHFLDLEINSLDITIFRKSTHTGQYTHISSFIPWSVKTAWIRSLASRAYKICSNQLLLQHELKTIQNFMSWNGFSRNMATKLINEFIPKHTNSNVQELPSSHNLPKIWIRLPFIGKYGNTLTRRFINKLATC